MGDPFQWWLLILGITIGAVVTWLVSVRLAREDADVSATERPAEAAWIADAIGERGGYVPEELVEEVLELHTAYLRGSGVEALRAADDDVTDEPVEATAELHDEALTAADDDQELEPERPERQVPSLQGGRGAR